MASILAARAYFAQDKLACSEVEMTAALVMGWAKVLSYSQAMMVVDEALRNLDFPQSVFTRWPVWQLLGRLTSLPGWSNTQGLQANSCLNFEVCKRTVAFYRRKRLEPGRLDDVDCPAPAEKMRFSYRAGVLRLLTPLRDLMEDTGGGVIYLPELRLFDLTNSLQRMASEEHLQLSKKHVEQRVISVKDLPLKLNWEGFQPEKKHRTLELLRGSDNKGTDYQSVSPSPSRRCLLGAATVATEARETQAPTAPRCFGVLSGSGKCSPRSF
eukprot:symbB.v1.2.026349.t2/scaffold2625.1/size74540/3